MTKEELYYEVVGVSGFEKCLDAFFESNICIPKVDNRHSCADVLYELLSRRIAELEALQSKYEAGQLQYHKLWGMYSDLKKQLELATKDVK
jgi:hypothetical protein